MPEEDDPQLLMWMREVLNELMNLKRHILAMERKHDDLIKKLGFERIDE